MHYVIFIGAGLLLTMLPWLRLRESRFLVLLLILYAIIFAGLRGASFDYEEYLTMFDLMALSDLPYPERFFIGKDVLFGVLIVAIQAVGLGPQMLFLASACLSIGLKYLALTRIFGRVAAPAFAMIGLYYFLHDFTQIRIAIALALCMVAFVHACRGSITGWVIYAAVALGFHFSTALLLAFTPPAVWRLTQPIARHLYSVAALLMVVLVVFPAIGAVDVRAEVYLDSDNRINATMLILGPIKAIVLTYLTWTTTRTARPLMKTSCAESLRLVWIGLILFYYLSFTVPALSFRVYEMFDAFSVFIVSAALLSPYAIHRMVALIYLAAFLLLLETSGILLPYNQAPWSLS